MTNPNGWPGKPGVPLNPERDGAHWLETPDGELAPYEWRAAGECERGRWPSYWVSQGEDDWEAHECKYLGPCLTPAEVEAKVKAARQEALEACDEIEAARMVVREAGEATLTAARALHRAESDEAKSTAARAYVAAIAAARAAAIKETEARERLTAARAAGASTH